MSRVSTMPWVGHPSRVQARDPVESARSRVARLAAQGRYPGLQYVVVDRARVLLDTAAGLSEAGTRAPLGPATLQMAYSTTKAITAIAVLQLAEQGRVKLDGPLSDYYSHPYGPQVTIRQLLAHTAGVPQPSPLAWFELESVALDRDARLRRLLEENPSLRDPPGARYRYTNLGYWLLEKAIEAASGEDFADYLRNHVFAPLGVPPEEARFELGEGLATGHAARRSPTTLVLRALTPRAYWAGSTGSWTRTRRVQHLGRGYGGLFCTARALAAVLGDLLQAQSLLLRPASKEELWTRQRTTRGALLKGTLGWITGTLNGARYFGKQGGGLGFHANVRVYPKLGLATAFMANSTEVTPGPIDKHSDALDGFFAQRS